MYMLKVWSGDLLKKKSNWKQTSRSSQLEYHLCNRVRRRTSFLRNFKINEVEMTAATIQALRIMMEGKLANCFQDMEARIISNIGYLVRDLRTDFVEE